MNDAYFMFVRLTGGIPDGTSPVTQLSLSEGDERTPYDSSIMRIRAAENVTDNYRPLKIINLLDQSCLTSDDYGIIRRAGRTNTPGPVRYMLIGEEEEQARWINIPDKDVEIQLTVERLPLTCVTDEHCTFNGVREEHHFHLLKWMRHLAYRKQDADAFDLIKSDQEEAAFYAYCAQAKIEKETRRHKPRVVRYGGL
jgi:hypothetical protein